MATSPDAADSVTPGASYQCVCSHSTSDRSTTPCSKDGCRNNESTDCDTGDSSSTPTAQGNPRPVVGEPRDDPVASTQESVPGPSRCPYAGLDPVALREKIKQEILNVPREDIVEMVIGLRAEHSLLKKQHDCILRSRIFLGQAVTVLDEFASLALK